MEGLYPAGMEATKVGQICRLSLKCELWNIESGEISWLLASKLHIPLNQDNMNLKLVVSFLLL